MGDKMKYPPIMINKITLLQIEIIGEIVLKLKNTTIQDKS